ncbi:MAG: hypothetical protein EPN88_04170, partial [Bacteroidetes bacterium]
MCLFTLKNLKPRLRGKKNVLILFLVLFASASIIAQETELSFQTGHVAAINKIVFSPDGNFLASADNQHKICIWDMTCLAQMTSFFYSDLDETDLISLLAFSPDNKKLIAGTTSGRLLVWDIGKSEKISGLSTGMVITNIIFISETTALMLSSSLMSFNLIDNSIKEIYKGEVADIYFNLQNGESEFCTLKGQLGKISLQTGLAILQPESEMNDLKKLLSKKYSGISRMKFGSNALVASGSFNLRFFNLPDKKKIFSASMPYMDERITDLVFLPKDNYFLVSNTDGKIYVYDYRKNKLVKTLKDHISEVNSIAVHPVKNIFATGSSDRSIILWDANTFLPIKRFYARASSIETLELNEPDQLLVFGNELGYTKMIKLNEKYPEIKSVKNHRQKVTDIVFTNGGKDLITSSNDNHLSKLASETLNIEEHGKFKSNFGFGYLLSNIIEKLHLYVEPYMFIDSISLSPEQDYIVADGYQVFKRAKKIRPPADQTGTKHKSKKIRTYIRNYEFCYSTSDLKKVKISQPQKAKNRSELKIDSIIMGVEVYNRKNGHISRITGADFDKTNNRLITSSKDATIKIWDLNSKKLVITIIPVDKNKRIFITADNYYFAPKNSLDAIGFKQGINFYPLEQFDLKYNRPDIVLEKLKNPDTLLIKMYRNAYEKRLKKSG